MRDYSKTRQTRRETLERHSKMRCQTFEIKIVKSKLNKEQKTKINQLFKEAKWFKNALVSDSKLSTTVNEVLVKVGDAFELRKLEFLPGAMKQSLKSEFIGNLKSLKTNKNNGSKIGRLQYKSFCNQIGLKQYGNTHEIVDKKHVRIQGFKKPFYCLGLKQIPENCEFANGKLVRKPDGLYVQITVFNEKKEEAKTNHECGLDFGVKISITTDTGLTYDVNVAEDKKILLASRRLSHCYLKNGKKKSNNYKKLMHKRQIAYQKLTNKKNDKANKIIHELLSNNDEIYMQDELLTKWHKDKYSSKKVQHSVLGTIKMKLKNSSKVTVIEANFPSTQLCPRCLNKTKHRPSKRIFECSFCGYKEQRDIKAAKLIKQYGKIKHLRGADVSLAELRFAGLNLLPEDSNPRSGEISSQDEKKQEAQTLKSWVAHKQEVTGSSPVECTIYLSRRQI